MTATFTDWPSGSHRTTATFAIERSGRGERATRVTLHPITGRPSAPKRLTYATKARIVDGDDGKNVQCPRDWRETLRCGVVLELPARLRADGECWVYYPGATQ